MIYTKFGLNCNTLKKKNLFYLFHLQLVVQKFPVTLQSLGFVINTRQLSKKKLPRYHVEMNSTAVIDLWTFVAFKSLSRSLYLCKTCDQNDGTGSCIVIVECWGQLLTISHPSEQLHKSQGCLWMTTEVLEPCWLT